MDVRQLRCLREVAQLGSFSRAAQQLRITQPALGLQIRRLEQELGTPLFLRHARGVLPTEAGSALAHHAAELLERLESARQHVQDLSGSPRGSVRFGITASMGLVLLPGLVRACRREIPMVTLDVVESVSEVVLDGIEAGRLLLGVSALHRKTSDLVFEPLTIEDLCFIGPTGDELAGQAPIPFKRVLQQPLILPTRSHKIRQLVDTAAQRSGRLPAVVFELDSVSLKKELIQSEGGYTILPFAAVHREVQERRLFARRP